MAAISSFNNLSSALLGTVNSTIPPPLPSGLSDKHIILLILGVLMVIGNGFLLIMLLRHRNDLQHHQKMVSLYLLFASMLGANLVFGVAYIPVYVAIEAIQSTDSTGCLVVMCLAGSQMILTSLTLFSLTVERYILLVWPFFHRKRVTPTAVTVAVVVTWLYAYGFGMIPAMGWNAIRLREEAPNNSSSNSDPKYPHQCRFENTHTGQYMGLLFFFHGILPSLISPAIYFHVWWTIQQFLRRRRSSQSPSLPSPPQSPQPARNRDTGTDSVSSHHNKSSLKSTRLLVVMFILFLFSWLPLSVWYAVLFGGFTISYLTDEQKGRNPLPQVFYLVAIGLGTGTCIISPYIYAIGHVHIRKALRSSLSSPCIYVITKIKSKCQSIGKNSKTKNDNDVEISNQFSGVSRF